MSGYQWSCLSLIAMSWGGRIHRHRLSVRSNRKKKGNKSNHQRGEKRTATNVAACQDFHLECFEQIFFWVGWFCPCFLPSLSSRFKETIIYEFPQTHEKISHKDTEKIRLLATPWKTLTRSQIQPKRIKINKERKVNWRSFIADGKWKTSEG